MKEKKSRRAIEKKIAIAELVFYVCDEIRKLGEGNEINRPGLLQVLMETDFL